jgi:hypothetical protein
MLFIELYFMSGLSQQSRNFPNRLKNWEKLEIQSKFYPVAVTKFKLAEIVDRILIQFCFLTTSVQLTAIDLIVAFLTHSFVHSSLYATTQQEKADDEYRRKLDDAARMSDERTAKKRAKRLKRKENIKKKKDETGDEHEDEDKKKKTKESKRQQQPPMTGEKNKPNVNLRYGESDQESDEEEEDEK